MFEEAKQELAQRFLGNDFSGALKNVYISNFVFIFFAFDIYCYNMYHFVYVYYLTAKLGMNLAVVITKFGFFRCAMLIFNKPPLS